ncbi:MAG: glycosyltransferase [Pyrinomonadaceae bacterium]|jgi:glycosyltransferase involved in cell wall biosynthesis|nr:glycosyltransferase [Blastocatellia bacterium]MDQ3489778.1 glycosyltransferase [Acidobacteriota bacterium]
MPSSLKSVHLTNYYHKHSGGISTSFNNLLAAAERHRRLVRLIVPGETEAVEDVNEFAKIYYVPAKYSPIFDKRYRLMTPMQYIPNGSIIRQILRSEMPDIIEVTDKYTLSMLGAMIRIGKFSQLNRPMLVHFSCERMDDNIASFLSKGRLAKWFARRVMGNYTIPSFDYHIANSVYTAEEFYQSVGKSENPRRSDWFFNKCWRFFNAPRVTAAERIFVCPRGVDAVHFSPHRKSADVRREMRELAGIPESSVILLYAGRLSPEKNIGLLPEIMKSLAGDTKRDYRLLVAGDGPQSNWLREQSDKHALGKIIQLGHLDKEKLAEFYANADVFVHPNPKEPFGIAPLEAMASGVPTVAPNAGGILSYASNENAWLVEPDSESFATAIREVIENDELRNVKIERALETARTNTREASTDSLFAAYDKMYEDFQRRKQLFTDMEASKRFDFAGELLNTERGL